MGRTINAVRPGDAQLRRVPACVEIKIYGAFHAIDGRLLAAAA